MKPSGHQGSIYDFILQKCKKYCDISLWRIDLLLQWTCIVFVFEIFTLLNYTTKN